MGRWLEKIKNAEVDTPRKPSKSPLGGLGGVAESAFPEIKEDDSLVTATDWVAWIAERCPLLPDDERYIANRLAITNPRHLESRARWYVNAWQQAQGAEPHSVKKENAGRRAANRTLLGAQS